NGDGTLDFLVGDRVLGGRRGSRPLRHSSGQRRRILGAVNGFLVAGFQDGSGSRLLKMTGLETGSKFRGYLALPPPGTDFGTVCNEVSVFFQERGRDRGTGLLHASCEGKRAWVYSRDNCLLFPTCSRGVPCRNCPPRPSPTARSWVPGGNASR